MTTPTTKLRLVLADVISNSGSIRDLVEAEISEENDWEYLRREVEKMQSAAHRVIAFLDHDVIGEPRQ